MLLSNFLGSCTASSLDCPPIRFDRSLWLCFLRIGERWRGQPKMESLPRDVVLNHIFHRLDFTSIVQLTSVSRRCRHLLSHRLSPHLPCLCVSRPPSSPSESEPEFSVLDLPSPTTARRLRIPVDGTNDPYLITTRTLRIYNTLTRESTPLPKTTIRYISRRNLPSPSRSAWPASLAFLLRSPVNVWRRPPTGMGISTSAISGSTAIGSGFGDLSRK